MSESTPSPASSAPESRFTQRSRPGVSARRKNPTVPLCGEPPERRADKTPQTMRTADPRSAAVVLSPSPAKTAAKEMGSSDWSASAPASSRRRPPARGPRRDSRPVPGDSGGAHAEVAEKDLPRGGRRFAGRRSPTRSPSDQVPRRRHRMRRRSPLPARRRTRPGAHRPACAGYRADRSPTGRRWRSRWPVRARRTNPSGSSCRAPGFREGSGAQNPPAGEGLVGRRAPKRCGARPYQTPGLLGLPLGNQASD